MKFILNILALFTFGIAVETSGQQTPHSTIKEMNNKAYQFYKDKNYGEAFKWYKLSAEQNDAKAQNNVGVMYRDGMGVSQDFVEARRWFMLAAEQGRAISQYNLGEMYYFGEGIKNDREAVRWFKLAANQMYSGSEFQLGMIFLTGDDSVRSYKEAIKWFRLAADQGDEDGKKYAGYIDKLNAFSEKVNVDSFLSTTCECIQQILNKSKDKLEFTISTQGCYQELYNKLIETNQAADFSDLSGLMFFGLEKQCRNLKKFDDMRTKYLNEKEESKIKNLNLCKIMRDGVFTERTSVGNIEITMKDSVQLVNFKQKGYYTKSRVEWLDDCRYKLIFIESTHPFEKSLPKEEVNRIVRIIDIINDDTVIFEVEQNGSYEIGSMTKLKRKQGN